MTTMTEPRKRVYAAIAAFWQVNGYGPSVRELVELCDLSSTSSVRFHMVRLRQDGLVDWVDRSPRTVRVVA